MNKQKFKLISIYSLIFGGVLGMVAILPYIKILSFLVMTLVSSVLIICYMEKKNEIGELTIKGGAIIGALIGFISLAGFLIIYLPLNALFGAIFNSMTDYFALSKYLLSLWWVLLFMGGLVTALFNSFALIAYVYIKDTFFMIEGKKEVKGIFVPRNKDNGI